MLRFLVAVLLLFPFSALAQKAPDPVEQNIAQQWQAAQTGQGNVAAAIDKLIAAWRETQAEVVKLRNESVVLREKCGEPCKDAK